MSARLCLFVCMYTCMCVDVYERTCASEIAYVGGVFMRVCVCVRARLFVFVFLCVGGWLNKCTQVHVCFTYCVLMIISFRNEREK